ncbi:hypothetical protein D3C78_976010 [compost metagenome]
MDRAALRRRLDHHHQHIGAGRVVADDEVVVLVVARVRAQLRRALVEVADLQVLAVPQATSEGDQGQRDGHRCHLGAGEVRQQAPERMLPGGVLLAALDGLFADADVGDGYRQQDQVGEDDHRHADRRTDGQLADHADVDDQQGNEAHRIGENRDHPGQEQLTEGAPGSGQGILGITGLQGDAVDLLHPMGNADGKDQERHQHRVRVQAKAHHMHQAQLPDHCHQGGDQHGDGAADAPGEPVEQDPGDDQRHPKEHRYHHQAVDQITDLFGEADDVHLHIGVLRLELVANFLLEQVRELLVVQLDLLPGVLRIGVAFQQGYIDDAGLEVVAHQAPDLAGLEHVVAQ